MFTTIGRYFGLKQITMNYHTLGVILILYIKTSLVHVHFSSHLEQVGYPNVGKSSTINTLLNDKKVPVSATPGRTKHFQVLNILPN